MKTIKIFPILIPAILLMTGCAKENQADDNSQVAVLFGTNIAFSDANTRASDGTWTAGDDVGIFMVATGTPLTLLNIAGGANNRWYNASTATESTLLTPDDATQTIFYPADGSSVDFIAYYPQEPTMTNFTYNIDASSQLNPESIDLMWTRANSGTPQFNRDNPEATLTFNHMLTKLVINALPGTGLVAADLVGMTATIQGVFTTAPFLVSDGAIQTPTGARSNVVMRATPTVQQYDAILLPETTTAINPVSVLFTLASAETFTWTVPNNIEFAASTINTYAITISRGEVTGTGVVSNWNPGNATGTGTAN